MTEVKYCLDRAMEGDLLPQVHLMHDLSKAKESQHHSHHENGRQTRVLRQYSTIICDSN